MKLISMRIGSNRRRSECRKHARHHETDTGTEDQSQHCKQYRDRHEHRRIGCGQQRGAKPRRRSAPARKCRTGTGRNGTGARRARAARHESPGRRKPQRMKSGAARHPREIALRGQHRDQACQQRAGDRRRPGNSSQAEFALRTRPTTVASSTVQEVAVSMRRLRQQTSRRAQRRARPAAPARATAARRLDARAAPPARLLQFGSRPRCGTSPAVESGRNGRA